MENTNVILRLIIHHYRPHTTVKTCKQIEREKWLLPGVRFSRWVLLPAAVVIQFCVGSLYAWSVFNHAVDLFIYGHNEFNMAPTTFYIACGFLGTSAAALGPWLERKGPLLACFVGITVFCSGHFLTALGIWLRQIWLVFFGYGVLGGIGTGLCYISPVSALQKWFPDRRGMASGFAVCGFGAGSIGVAKISIPLMETVGLPLTFVVLGSSHLVVMTIGALVLRTPPPDYVVNGMRSDGSLVSESYDANQSYQFNMEETTRQQETTEGKLTLIESLTSKDFRLIFIMIMSNVLFGVCCFSRLSNMVTDIFGRSANEASTIVSINGGFNLGGRLLFAVISDYLGRKTCYIIMLTIQLVVVACFSTVTSGKAYWAFIMSVWTVAMCYGGGFGTIPAYLTDRFGPHNTGPCHGVILVAWSLSGVGGGMIYIAVFNIAVKYGYTAHDPFPYNVNSWWILGIICIGWVCMLFVSPTKKDIIFRENIRLAMSKIVRGRGRYDVKSSLRL